MTDLFEDLPDDAAERDDDLGTDELIQRAIDLVSSAKAMPLSASVLISRDEVLDVLVRALERQPDEVRRARWLLKEKDEFLAERAREAEAVMADVRARAEHMVSRSEVVRQAKVVAQRIVDDANEEARRLRHEAEDYCDQKLAGMEIVLERITRTVRSGRQKLQATSPSTHEPPAAPPPGGEEAGFFDQDLA